MHAFLEYIPLILFFVVYKFADIYWATGSLIIASILQILYYFIKKEKVPTKTWVLFGLITVFGGLTIFLQDDLFLKWKVSIINWLFAVALIISRYVFNKNIIKNMLDESMELPEKVWSNLNLSWAGFFTFCGAINIYIAFNFEQETWVNFKVFGLMGLTFVFAITSIMSLYKYLPQEEDSESKEKE